MFALLQQIHTRSFFIYKNDISRIWIVFAVEPAYFSQSYTHVNLVAMHEESPYFLWHFAKVFWRYSGSATEIGLWLGYCCIRYPMTFKYIFDVNDEERVFCVSKLCAWFVIAQMFWKLKIELISWYHLIKTYTQSNPHDVIIIIFYSLLVSDRYTSLAYD